MSRYARSTVWIGVEFDEGDRDSVLEKLPDSVKEDGCLEDSDVIEDEIGIALEEIYKYDKAIGVGVVLLSQHELDGTAHVDLKEIAEKEAHMAIALSNLFAQCGISGQIETLSFVDYI